MNTDDIDDAALTLSLDQGGHSTRAIVYDKNGKIVVRAKYQVGVERPQDNWVEQDGAVIVQSMLAVLAEIRQQLGSACGRIVSAGLATQRSNSMCWDSQSGQALSPAISWQDTRSYHGLSEYKPYVDEIHRKTGLYVTAHYGATKLRWCLDNLDAVQQALREQRLAWGPLASYLVYALTDERQHLVDPANASRTLLWNLQQRDWDSQLLQWFHVPTQPLPRCVTSRYPYGHISLGEHRIPLTLVTGDQSAAMFAFGLPQPNTLYINLGTGAFLQYSTGADLVQVPNLLSGILYHDGVIPHYSVECTVNGAGSALSLVEEQIGMDVRYAQKNFEQWLQCEDDLPLFLNGVSGLGTPFWISDFPSRFIGADALAEKDAGPRKIAAVGESILFLIYLNMTQLRDAGLNIERIWMTGGLAVSDQLCQKLADLSASPIYRPTVQEATARGTAWLASLEDRDWNDNNAGTQFTPRTNPSLMQRYQRWRREMDRAIQQHKGLSL